MQSGEILESDTVSWHSHSSKTLVKQGDIHKMVYLSYTPIKSLTIEFNELSKTIEVPKGYSCFQSIIGEAIQSSEGNEPKSRIVGRTIGLVKNGAITEEFVLNGDTNEIIGVKY